VDTYFASSRVFLVLLISYLFNYIPLPKIKMPRKAKISRKTKETTINVETNIDGKGKYKIDSGIGFLNHMLEQLSKHSLIDINLKAKGDTHIDLHHTTEDTGNARRMFKKSTSLIKRN